MQGNGRRGKTLVYQQDVTVGYIWATEGSREKKCKEAWWTSEEPRDTTLPYSSAFLQSALSFAVLIIAVLLIFKFLLSEQLSYKLLFWLIYEFFSFCCPFFIHRDVEKQRGELLRQYRHIQWGQYHFCLPLPGTACSCLGGPRLTSALFVCLEQHASAGTVAHVISDMMRLTGIMSLMMMISNAGQLHMWQSRSTDTYYLSVKASAETEAAGQCGIDANGPIYLEVYRLDTHDHGSVILVGEYLHVGSFFFTKYQNVKG